MSQHEGKTHSHEQRDSKDITVETLSSPPIKVAPAAIVRRIVAGIIDSIIIVAVSFVSDFAIGQTPIAMSWVQDVVLVVLVFAYYFLQEWLAGATIGKRLLKLRVCDKEGDPCTLIAALERNLIRLVDWLPVFYLLGAASILASKDRQRIGDRVAGTIVANAPEKDINPPPAPFLFH